MNINDMEKLWIAEFTNAKIDDETASQEFNEWLENNEHLQTPLSVIAAANSAIVEVRCDMQIH